MIVILCELAEELPAQVLGLFFLFGLFFPSAGGKEE